MSRPDFFIVGAPRCGTTSIYRHLRQHPQVFMPDVKEPKFFDKDLHGPRQPRELEDYLGLFEDAPKGARVGEASTHYLYSQEAAKHIARFSPDGDVFIFLRDPVEVMRSWHGLMVSKGRQQIHDFAEAIETARSLRGRPPSGKRVVQDYFGIVSFADQVQRFLSCFGRNQVHVVFQNELLDDTPEVYRRICKILEVDPDVDVDFEIHGSHRDLRWPWLQDFLRDPPTSIRQLARALLPASTRAWIGERLDGWNRPETRRDPIDPSLRRELRKELSDQIDLLEELLDRDLSHWREGEPSAEHS